MKLQEPASASESETAEQSGDETAVDDTEPVRKGAISDPNAAGIRIDLSGIGAR